MSKTFVESNLKDMYVIYDKQGLKSSPVAFYDTDAEAFRDLSLSIKKSSVSNPNIHEDDFFIVCIGTFDMSECRIVSSDSYVLDGNKIAKESSAFIKERFKTNVPNGSILSNREEVKK